MFVNFNDTVRAGQPIAQIDQEIFAARVNEAKAAVARATAQVQRAVVERAKVAVVNAQTAKRLAEAQSDSIGARQDEVERQLHRQLALARTGSGTERERITLHDGQIIRNSATSTKSAFLKAVPSGSTRDQSLGEPTNCHESASRE